MPLIEKQKREARRPVTIKLEQRLADRLSSYVRFLESSRDHVVGSILRYVMDRDKDFVAHLAISAQNSMLGQNGVEETRNEAGKAVRRKE